MKSFSYLLCGLLLLCGVNASCAAADDKGCEDLLAALHKKPDYVEFLNCKQRTDLQGSPIEAKYRVKGNRAADAEDYLVKEFKIKKLGHTCCVWESADNSWRDERKRQFTISMSTEDTKVDKREDWAKLDYFYIVLDLFRDDP